MILQPKKIKSVTLSIVSPSICHEVMGPDAMIFVSWKVNMKITQSCLALCNPMDYTVHGILQARILEWVAFPISRESSQPRDQTQISHTAWILLLCFTINEGNFLSSQPHKVWPSRKQPILPPVRFSLWTRYQACFLEDFIRFGSIKSILVPSECQVISDYMNLLLLYDILSIVLSIFQGYEC